MFRTRKDRLPRSQLRQSGEKMLGTLGTRRCTTFALKRRLLCWFSLPSGFLFFVTKGRQILKNRSYFISILHPFFPLLPLFAEAAKGAPIDSRIVSFVDQNPRGPMDLS